MCGSELDNGGFNLYRSTSPDGAQMQLNAELIPSLAAGSTTGYSYTWSDRRDLTGGTTYYYWLEALDLDGVGVTYGPVSSVWLAPSAVTLATWQAGPTALASTRAWVLVLLAATTALLLGSLRSNAGLR